MKFLLVFIGLEHTGHHLWTGSDVFNRIKRTGIMKFLEKKRQGRVGR